MSMTKELAEQHLGDPAVFCCRRQKGLTISAADLEDPSIFSDMEEAGLLKLSPDGLTVAEVLGEHQLTVESCDNREKEVRDLLQTRIDAEDRRLARLAEKIIKADKPAAARAYIRVEQSKLPLDLVEKIVQDPEIDFTVVPQRTYIYAEKLQELGVF